MARSIYVTCLNCAHIATERDFASAPDACPNCDSALICLFTDGDEAVRVSDEVLGVDQWGAST